MKKITMPTLTISEDDEDVAYLQLPGHPGLCASNIVAEQYRLKDLLKEYSGPDIYFDLDKNKNIIGIEIVG